MSSSGLPSNGRHVGSAVSGPGLCVRLLQTACIAVVALPSCTVPGGCSPAVTAIGLPTRASKIPRAGAAGGGPRLEQGEGWITAEADCPIGRTIFRN